MYASIVDGQAEQEECYDSDYGMVFITGDPTNPIKHSDLIHGVTLAAADGTPPRREFHATAVVHSKRVLPTPARLHTHAVDRNCGAGIHT